MESKTNGYLESAQASVWQVVSGVCMFAVGFIDGRRSVSLEMTCCLAFRRLIIMTVYEAGFQEPSVIVKMRCFLQGSHLRPQYDFFQGQTVFSLEIDKD